MQRVGHDLHTDTESQAFLILRRGAIAALVATDRALLDPIFDTVSESLTEPPFCDVLFVYCTLKDDSFCYWKSITVPMALCRLLILMIFDMRLLEDIEDGEIEAFLDRGVSERIDSEYKVHLNHRDDDERASYATSRHLQTRAEDISSLASARTDLDDLLASWPDRRGGSPSQTVDRRARTQSRRRAKLVDFDIQEKNVAGKIILVARIAESDQKPHMVTIANRTEFCIRFADGKRAMSYSEIREAFRGDQTSRRLSNIEVAISASVNGERT